MAAPLAAAMAMANAKEEAMPEEDPETADGISNRPRDEERARQERVPPAGTAKGETDPALRPRPDEKTAPRDPSPKQPDPESPPET